MLGLIRTGGEPLLELTKLRRAWSSVLYILIKKKLPKTLELLVVWYVKFEKIVCGRHIFRYKHSMFFVVLTSPYLPSRGG